MTSLAAADLVVILGVELLGVRTALVSIPGVGAVVAFWDPSTRATQAAHNAVPRTRIRTRDPWRKVKRLTNQRAEFRTQIARRSTPAGNIMQRLEDAHLVSLLVMPLFAFHNTRSSQMIPSR
jgi:hypothetical protein